LLSYVLVALAVIPSPILMFINSEAIAVVFGLRGAPPLAIAGALAVGQTIGFSLIFLFGEALCERSTRLQERLERFDVERFKARTPPLIALASVFGLPPLNLSCVVASATGASLLPLLPLIISGRFMRYWLVASIPAYFAHYVDVTWLPAWLSPA
jgi:membrane protein YqaA with SNARE-associated domain